MPRSMSPARRAACSPYRITPLVSSFPGVLIVTAEYASSRLPLQLSSCGWKIEIFAPATLASRGHGSPPGGALEAVVCENAGDANVTIRLNANVTTAARVDLNRVSQLMATHGGARGSPAEVTTHRDRLRLTGEECQK